MSFRLKKSDQLELKKNWKTKIESFSLIPELRILRVGRAWELRLEIKSGSVRLWVSWKWDCVSWEWDCVCDWVAECLRDREAKSTQHKEIESTQHRETNERELKFEWSENAWKSLGPSRFVIQFKRCVLHPFFFYLNARIGLFGGFTWYSRYGPSQRESARFSVIWPEFEPR